MFGVVSDLGDDRTNTIWKLGRPLNRKSDIDWREHLHLFVRTNKVSGDFFRTVSVPTENRCETWSHDNVSYCYTL
jgi:hypothetical protein